MVIIPDLDEYDINVLIALGNHTYDEFSRSRIKMAIVNKLLEFNYPMFILIEKFRHSKFILKEAHADAILIMMKGNDYHFDDIIVNEILMLASYEALMCYGADSACYEFNIKCKDEFYKRGYEIEDKIELQRKVTFGKKLIKNLKKRKVIKNDKY